MVAFFFFSRKHQDKREVDSGVALSAADVLASGASREEHKAPSPLEHIAIEPTEAVQDIGGLSTSHRNFHRHGFQLWSLLMLVGRTSTSHTPETRLARHETKH